MRFHFAVAALLLAGCSTLPPVPDVSGVDAVLIGEQHDAKDHPRMQKKWVDTLAERGTLTAVTLEMAERGHSTAGLLPTASEEEVRKALNWNRAGSGWPWERYAPAIMAAVRAGVPVMGANLPRDEMRKAMGDVTLDALLPASSIQKHQQNIRTGHCDMLPEHQVTPMVRVQVARDFAMAQTISGASQPGKQVVLIAGRGHVLPELGVPVHLPQRMRATAVVLPAQDTGRDYCAEFKKEMDGRKKPA